MNVAIFIQIPLFNDLSLFTQQQKKTNLRPGSYILTRNHVVYDMSLNIIYERDRVIYGD